MTSDSAPRSRRRETIGIVLLFAMIYFVQGIAEPTEGLIAQPVRSLLKSWGYSAAAIAGFGAMLSIPWMLKPLYGLLTDFVPLAGTRRRSYLIVSSGAATAGLVGLYLFPLPGGAYTTLRPVVHDRQHGSIRPCSPRLPDSRGRDNLCAADVAIESQPVPISGTYQRHGVAGCLIAGPDTGVRRQPFSCWWLLAPCQLPCAGCWCRGFTDR